MKTNIGHLDAAAGVAGLIKTVLALQHGRFPPSLHFESPNPKIDLANTPVLRQHGPSGPGRGPRTPRRAGVSSFGIGGTNAHVVLEEAPPRTRLAPGRRKAAAPAVRAHARRAGGGDLQLRDALEAHPDVAGGRGLHAASGAPRFDHRRSFVCSSREEAIALRQRRIRSASPPKSATPGGRERPSSSLARALST